jgi:membrane protease YdiL (CAAX protease family)
MVSLALAYSSVSGDILRPALRQLDASELAETFPYLVSALISVIDILLMLGLVAAVARLSPWRLLASSGFAAPIRGPLAWSVAWFLPALLACIALATPAADIAAADLLWLSIGAPLSEELLYRGLAVGVLVRLCGWHWAAACVWPAMFFGIVHAGQGADLMSIAGIVTLTALGGLLFGWLYVRWTFNLWAPVLLHVGMNGLWLLFALGENALGGVAGNLVRLGIVLLAVVATLRMTRERAEPAG